MERYYEIEKEIKELTKQYDKEVLQMCGNISDMPYTIEKDGKLHINRNVKETYWDYKTKYVLPLEERLNYLEKKMEVVIEQLITEGKIIEKEIEIVDYLRGKVNGRITYGRVLIRLK